MFYDVERSTQERYKLCENESTNMFIEPTNDKILYHYNTYTIIQNEDV